MYLWVEQWENENKLRTFVYLFPWKQSGDNRKSQICAENAHHVHGF